MFPAAVIDDGPLSHRGTPADLSLSLSESLQVARDSELDWGSDSNLGPSSGSLLDSEHAAGGGRPVQLRLAFECQ